MIEHLSELNRVMLLLHSLTGGVGTIRRSILIRECKSISLEGRLPDHELSVSYASDIGFVKGKQSVRITELGKAFVDLNPEEHYELSIEQKRFLLRSCFLDGLHGRRVKEIFKCFEPSSDSETLEWSATDGTPIAGDLEVLEYLVQLGVVRRHALGLRVSKQYASTIGAFVTEPKGFTEAQLLLWLEEKKKLGRFAEEIVLRFERERLATEGLVVESKCVRAVSQMKVNAGFDIESFTGPSHNMGYNRFIEVKGSSKPGLRFVWSQNEIKVAEQLRDRYWIYYVGGISKRTGTTLYKPIAIQDPIATLDGDTRFTQTPNGLVVEGKVRGDLA